MKKKNKENKNKIILGDFICTICKKERDCRNKTVSRCRLNYALSKLIVDDGLKNLWGRQNPDSSEFTRYDRSSGTRSRMDRVYTDIKIANNIKINYIMVSFTNHYNAILMDRFPSKTKIGKDSWYFNNSLLYKPEFSLTTGFSFFIENTKHNHSSLSDWWENTNSSFKEDARTFSGNSRKYQNFNTEKKTAKLYKKENFEPEIKPMIENLQDELQKTNKQKVLNFVLTLDDGSWRAKNSPKLS